VPQSEDLYRKDTDASTLASKINDVRGMMWGMGASSKSIGHVDTWTAWVDPANTAVIQAVDWLGNDAYAYFEGVSIDNGAANNAYWGAVERVRAVSQGKPVWTTETGWPQNGAAIGNAQPSIQNMQTFWWQVVSTWSAIQVEVTLTSRRLAPAVPPSISSGTSWYVSPVAVNRKRTSCSASRRR
jgi:exo-beta-1,3-glucanase (GH17 family)